MSARTLAHRVDDSTARLSARVQSAVTYRVHMAQAQPEEGANTAEYAVGTVAAIAFAAALLATLKSGAVPNLVGHLITGAFKKFLPGN